MTHMHFSINNMTLRHICANFLCMNSITAQIGLRMRAARNAKGMSQSELGLRLGLNQGYISRLENGTSECTSSQILNIARAVDVPVAYLFNDQDETAKKAADLSDEAIEFALAWQELPEEQRVAMKAAVDALAKN